MGDMWRSQKMQLVQMIVQNDAAHAVVNKLGSVGLLQFRDLNAGTSFYKRSFVEEVRKCDELNRILRTIKDEFAPMSITVADKDEAYALSLSLDDVESKIHEIYHELEGLKAQQELLIKNDNALHEQKLVLDRGKKIYTKKGSSEIADESMSKERTQMAELMALSEFATTSSSVLGQVSGVIKVDHVAALERTLFRATRGNAVFESHEIERPLLDGDGKSSEPVTKAFFMVLFAGEVMRDKISKVCSYFGASLYKFPDTSDELDIMNLRVDERLHESSQVLSQGESVMHELLSNVATKFATWDFTVNKEKMIFDTLNMCEFDIKRHVFLAEGWVPVNRYDVVVKSLEAATLECGLDTRPIINKMEATKLTPPTHIPVTNFTSGFQALVNTYGTPRYREVNPGAFCCIFFPFLFGIMFGDFGHGSMLAMFGYFLIKKEKEWGDGAGLNDMVAMCYGGRYIILLNGLFGAYVGFLYNEAFAFPMNFFGGSRWFDASDPSEGCEVYEDGTVPTCDMVTPYPFGIDPIWHYTANKITFFNSFKMKISIIVGVIQMSVGICLSFLNHVEYGDTKRIFFEYLPEMIFFEGIFGYLVFTIFYKWSVDWNGDVGVPGNPGPQPSPALLTLLINMFMSPTTTIDVPLYGIQCYTDCPSAISSCHIDTIAAACPATCGTGEGVDSLTKGGGDVFETKVCFSELQLNVQFYLLIAAFVSVPFLLFPVPFIELAEHNAEMAEKRQYDKLDDEEGKHEDDEDDEHGFSFGDAFIHQAIHTIEFVLGAISNTASYLRLWALSLAHSQLAELFKDMILTDIGIKMGLSNWAQGIVLWLAFSLWAIISVVVLMVMENLSSFLHALRLQWVEFQNKFFYGDGQKYEPFNFQKINEAVEE